MTIIAIMQPTYLPWLGYFDLIDRVDRFVFLDDVQVVARSWGVRNRIRTEQGELYLTVPLSHELQRDERLFTNTAIDYSRDWPSKHLKTIAQAYARAPHFPALAGELEDVLHCRYATIGDLNMTLVRRLAARIGIGTEIVRSSEIGGITGRKDDRLVSICRALGATHYLSPQGSAVYIEQDRPGGAFSAAGIELYYHAFVHPEYRQRGDGFLSHMAIVDLLANCGFEAALEIIRSGRRPMIPCLEFRRTLGSQPDVSTSQEIQHADWR